MQCRDTHKLKGPIYTILTFSSHTYVTLPFGRDLPINHNTSLPTKWYYLSIFLQDITKGGYHFLFFDDKLTSGNNSMEEVTKGGRRREWYAKWWWWVQNHYKQSLVDHIFQTGRDIVRQSSGGVWDSGEAVVQFWITNLGVQKCLKFGFICFGLFLAKRVRRWVFFEGHHAMQEFKFGFGWCMNLRSFFLLI